uniref:Uncharacterized protein n=1 Tax=Setaria italica TaxID=4555 RepID=K3YXF4_SETIT
MFLPPPSPLCQLIGKGGHFSQSARCCNVLITPKLTVTSLDHKYVPANGQKLHVTPSVQECKAYFVSLG